eukprot:g6990.t1
MSAEPAERSYVVASLERILMDYDHHYERAWRMLALTTAADACVQADYLKDAFTSAIDTMQPLAQIVAELLPRAMTISRRLAKAALRLEEGPAWTQVDRSQSFCQGASFAKLLQHIKVRVFIQAGSLQSGLCFLSPWEFGSQFRKIVSRSATRGGAKQPFRRSLDDILQACSDGA